MRTLVAVLLVVACPAFAEDRIAAMKVMFAAQTNTLKSTDDASDKAFKATLTRDALVTWNGERPRADFGSWNAVPADEVVVAGVKYGWAGAWGWIVADLRITYTWYAEPEGAGNPHPTPETHAYRWAALVVPDGAGVKTKVLWVAQGQSDHALMVMNYVQELVPMASPSPNVALLAKPSAIVAHLAKDAATSVLGTSEADRGLGPADAKKLVSGWSKLALEVVDTRDDHDKSMYETFELAVGDAAVAYAKLRMKLPGKPKWYPLEGVVILRKGEIVALVYGS
jgi:hypothetical protein